MVTINIEVWFGGDKISTVKELITTTERDEWLSTRKRIGFIGSDKTVTLQCDIWTIELYSKTEGGFSLFITLDSDESWMVCDFE